VYKHKGDLFDRHCIACDDCDNVNGKGCRFGCFFFTCYVELFVVVVGDNLLSARLRCLFFAADAAKKRQRSVSN
jgi:hypothetical protein